jgi:small subunit ribosomal protein S5
MMKKQRNQNGTPAEKEFDQRVIDLARVTRVMAGGKRMRFRACVAIGDKKGRCGIGLAKGADVTLAINKAVNRAHKNLVVVPIVRETIPHAIYIKEKSAKILLKPAPVGTGIKAGGAVRILLDLAGVPNVVSKILGTNNKINNVAAVLEAFKSFKYREKDLKKFTPEKSTEASVVTEKKVTTAKKPVRATKKVVEKVTSKEEK